MDADSIKHRVQSGTEAMGILLVSLCLGLAMAAPARDLEEFMASLTPLLQPH